MVILTKIARKDMARLTPAVAVRVLDALERFSETGHGDVKRLQGVQPPVLPAPRG